jgi:hypothetical protein
MADGTELFFNLQEDLDSLCVSTFLLLATANYIDTDSDLLWGGTSRKSVPFLLTR